METKENFPEKGYYHNRILRCVGFGVLGFLGFSAFLIIGGAVIMLLWNWLMPLLFHITIITFWQAVGLALLARLLFGSSHHRWNHWDKARRMHEWHGGCCGRHPFHNWKSRREQGENCRAYYRSWQYYDKFWEEEGEKAFQDYVKRKSENPDKMRDNIV